MPTTPEANAPLPHTQRSRALLERALRVIPCATQTMAKGPTAYVRGISPHFLQRGKGAHVVDVDGNRYLDMVMALGPVSLGYGYEAVDNAIREQLNCGISFSLVHPLEVEVAEQVQRLVPSAERVRFSKTGADATSAAVRLARAHTGRSKVLSCGYHGWHDFHAATMARNGGVPTAVRSLSTTFPYNDLAAVERLIDHDTACVLLEPVAFELPAPGFLEGLRSLCDRNGCVLIFDEMWTGFRVALGGAQAYFGVRPDLSCFSKAIANGMPLSVVCGRRDIMQRCEEDVFFFTTFGGETLSLAAAAATLQVLQSNRVPAYLSDLGQQLMAGIQQVMDDHDLTYLRCSGLPCRSALLFDPTRVDTNLAKSFVQQELLRRGILWTGFHALSFSHTPSDIGVLLSAYRQVLPLLDGALRDNSLQQRLQGEPIGAPLRPHGSEVPA